MNILCLIQRNAPFGSLYNTIHNLAVPDTAKDDTVFRSPIHPAIPYDEVGIRASYLYANFMTCCIYFPTLDNIGIFLNP